MKANKIIIGITGASGSIYAKQLISRLLELPEKPEVAVIFSENGKKVWDFELNGETLNNERVTLYSSNDFFASVASGSANYNAMVIIPCSMGTLGKIASGTSDNLIIRAADVMLKENRKLILVPREMPYNLIHLRNMETLLLAGSNLIPASPSFYNHPKTVDDIIRTVTDKVLSSLGYKNGLFEWGNEKQ